jgi:PleD family two-component response regulator
VDAQRVDVGGRETYFSVSVGVATVGPGEPIDLDELFLRADREMYRGKGLQYTTVNEEAEAPV